MDFARKQMEKYGWSEGKGLGKSENGILQAIKPKPKHGQGGIGLDIAEEFTNHWWQKIYNNAADNIEVNKNGNGEVKNFSTKKDESINTTVWIKSKQPKSNNISKVSNEYMEKFINRATLTNGTTLVENKKSENDNNSSDSESDNAKSINNPKLTDEELFSACGGRTAHKGARHGIKSNGKLARINKQEDNFLEKMKNIYKSTEKTPVQKSSCINKIDCKEDNINNDKYIQEKKSLQNAENSTVERISNVSDIPTTLNDGKLISVKKTKKNRKRKNNNSIVTPENSEHIELNKKRKQNDKMKD